MPDNRQVLAGLADRGARVVVAARQRERLEALTAEIATEGGEAAAVRLEV